MEYKHTLSADGIATLKSLMTSSRSVVVVTYYEAMAFKSRKDAKAFFMDCMLNSEGAERERYTNVYEKLETTKWKIVDDTDNWEENEQLLDCFKVRPTYRSAR